MKMWGTKLPKKAGGRYIVTLKCSFGLQVRQADYTEYPKGNYYWSVLPDYSTHHDDVIAWMKEPKPYKRKD
jgi:hypothetical protein